MDFSQLEKIAQRIRCHIVKMVAEAGSGHAGGSLSAVEIFIMLFFQEMNIDPEQPRWHERDYFVLSKGHATPVYYATLAERGFFPVEELMTFRKINSRLQGHPDRKSTPGVDMTTGSLGQGLSSANGMALALKMDGHSQRRVFAILGDGELQEGQIWEAAMTSAHYKLDNLTIFVDYNGLQIDGVIYDIMSPAPIADKFRAFNWHVQEIDGHDFSQIARAIAEAQEEKGRPSAIIARTVKGKGVSYMENEADWHGKAPDGDQLCQALTDLKGEAQ